MRERTLKARMARDWERSLELIAARIERPRTVWWLSFADEISFRGAVVIHAEDFITAIIETTIRHINPGGECQGMPAPEDVAVKIPEEWKNRLLSRTECEELDRSLMS